MAGLAKDRIRALFVCHYNQRRSATAERIFGREPNLEVLSAGTAEEAMVRVNARMLDWADVVFVMDDKEVRAVRRLFPGHPGLDRIVCLDIRDDYHFLDPELVALLRERTRPHLERLRDG